MGDARGGPCSRPPWLPAAAGWGWGGDLLLNSPGSPRGWKRLQENGVFSCPRSPCLHWGVLPGSSPGLAAPAGSIPVPFSPRPRAAGGGRLPAPSPRAAGAAGASASLLHESRVIFSSLMPVAASVQARPRLRLPPRRAGGCPSPRASSRADLGAVDVVWGWRRASRCRVEHLASPTRGWDGGGQGPW